MPTSQKSGEIELVVRCDCGFEARGTESKIIPIVQRHGVEVHRQSVTREEVLAMAKPA